MFKNLLNRFIVSPPAPAQEASVSDDVALADRLVGEGNAREDAGDLPAATALYRQAVSAAPRHARGHLNLGIALAAQGDHDGATAAYEAVLAIDPRHPFGNYNFARLAYLRRDQARAEALLRAALLARPEFPQAQMLLSNVLDELGRTGEAADAMNAALRLQPDDAGAWLNLAALQRKLRRLDEADAAVDRAFALDPSAAALNLRSVILRDHGFVEESMVPLRAAIAADPESLAYRSAELMYLNFDETQDARALFERHVEFGRRLEQAVPARFDRWLGSRAPDRRLRVGYVSGDLRMHPVTMFLLPVLERHDRAAVEVFCYSSTLVPDDATDRVIQLADHWRDARDMDDTQLADAIHADAIDVLVDLSGHTTQSRLASFSQRPAPVQASWLGYLNTTGLARMDWRLCDRRTDPPETQALHTERLAWLPESQWCYRPFVDVAPAASAPVERNGFVTFGSFNNAPKITPAMCRRWGQVLARTPDSRLLVGDVSSERKRAAIRADIASQGVAPERVEFIPRLGVRDYFAAISGVDVALDTVPYGGGTTTLDALWMGVPVVAARGPTPVSRSAASLLAALAMDDWIAPSVADYVDVAARQAADHAGIAALRRALRQRLLDSPLTDEPRFVRDLEAQYRRMWQEHLRAA
jgi:predicted O-linked N-acetylglucosamine transferase (SPINDLY family)